MFDFTVNNQSVTMTMLAICCCVPCCGAAATGRPATATVDRHLLLARRSAANPPQRSAVIERTDKQMDRRTPDSFIDLAPHITRAVLLKTPMIILWKK